MATGWQTEFTTYFGTGILGMFVKWGNTAVTGGTIDASTSLSVDLTMNLYAAGLSTESTFPFDATASAPSGSFYLQFANPYATEDEQTATYTQVPYDAVIGELKVTTAPGPPHTAVVEWDDGLLELSDRVCTAEGTPDLTNCPADLTTNDWTTTTTGEQCVEKWNLLEPAIRCVRIENTFARLFHSETVDGNTSNNQDIKLEYRSYAVTAGWIFAAGSTSPLKMDFARQVVDFGAFLSAAPEASYNGGMSGMAVGCASITAAVMTFLF